MPLSGYRFAFSDPIILEKYEAGQHVLLHPESPLSSAAVEHLQGHTPALLCRFSCDDLQHGAEKYST